MTWNQKALFSLTGVVLMLSMFVGGKFFMTQPNGIRIGTKNFTEQIILGEILAQYIETRLHVSVQLKKNLGGTFVCFQALQSGSLDMYVEYTGTGLTAILNEKTLVDPDEVFQKVHDQFKSKWGLLWQKPLGFNNTYAIAMRREYAQSLGVKTISDLAAYKDQLRAGFNHEFLERPDGYKGLSEHYGIEFENTPIEMDSGLLYRAIAEKKVDVICGFATDGRIPAFDLVILSDNKAFFPPYHAAPLVCADLFDEYPEMKGLLKALSNTISDAEMAGMNYLVDEKGQLPSTVANKFLKEEFGY